MTDAERYGITRRAALKVIAASAALGPAACSTEGSVDSAHETLSGFPDMPIQNPLATGTLTDPDLLRCDGKRHDLSYYARTLSTLSVQHHLGGLRQLLLSVYL